MKLKEYDFIYQVNRIRNDVLQSILEHPPQISEIRDVRNPELKLTIDLGI